MPKEKLTKIDKRFDKMRKFARKHKNKKWYKAFLTAVSTSDVRTAYTVLAKSPAFETMKKIIVDVPATGPKIGAGYMLCLYKPEHKSECSNCGKRVRAVKRPIENGEWQCCSAKCAAQNPDRLKKTVVTNRKKFGVDNPSQSEQVKRKRVRTFLKRFGVDNPWKSEKVKAKIRKTTKKNYGVENASQSKIVKERKKRTFRKNFGADHWTQNEERRKELPGWDEKRMATCRKTWMEKYGVENPRAAEEVKEKLRETWMRNHGVDNPRKAEAVKEKMRKKFMELYGVSNPGVFAAGKTYGFKTVVDSRGIEHTVMGYEHHLIKRLDRAPNIKRIVSASTKLPQINYKYKGRYRNYHPDMLAITKEGKNILIEVKSTYTLLMDIGMIAAKCKAATRYMMKRGGIYQLVVVVPTARGKKKGKTKYHLLTNPTCVADIVKAFDKHTSGQLALAADALC